MTEADAILVDVEHINVMIWAGLWLKIAHGDQPLTWLAADEYGDFAAPTTLEPATADRTGQMLIDTNATAVGTPTRPAYRYNTPQYHRWQVVEVLRAVHFYQDQIAAADDWPRNEANHFCQALIDRLVVQLSGYLGATAHITATTIPARQSGL